MNPISVSEARKNIYALVDDVSESHEPLLITGKRDNAILLSEKDWSSIQETLSLTAIPGMHESLTEGSKTPLSECRKTLDW